MTKQILDVKILGRCSVHIGDKEPKKYVTGVIVPDKYLHCIQCELNEIKFN